MSFEKYIVIFAHLAIFYKVGAKADLIPEIKSCIGKYQIFSLQPNVLIKDRSYSTIQCQNCEVLAQQTILDNTGTTISINFTYDDQKQIPTITNGPLEGKGTYRFKHAYFHWLPSTPDDWRFNNVYFSAELHLVFYNIKYGDYEKALGQNEGVAVFSVGFRVRQPVNRYEFEILASGLKDISKGYTNTSIPNLNLYSLFPPIMSDYNTYIGTMISEEIGICKSDVIWIDFEQGHKIEPDVVNKFHNLRTSYNVTLIDHAVKYREPKTQIYRSVHKPDAALESNNGRCFSFKINDLLLMLILMYLNTIML